jgi:hypothetical protein
LGSHLGKQDYVSPQDGRIQDELLIARRFNSR